MPRDVKHNLDFFMVKVNIQGRDMDCNLEADLQVNPANLDAELVRQPSYYAYYAALAEYAMDAYQGEKSELDRLTSELDQEVRERAVADGEKVTEAVVQARIRLDPRYLAQQKKLSDSALNYRLLNVAKEAFIQRKDMLVEYVRRQAREQGQLGGVRQLNEQVSRGLNAAMMNG